MLLDFAFVFLEVTPGGWSITSSGEIAENQRDKHGQSLMDEIRYDWRYG